MSVELVHVDGQSCQLVERAGSPNVSNSFVIPVAKNKLVRAMKTLLSDSNKMDIQSGNITVARRRDELRVEIGAMAIPLKWSDVFPIVLEA